jgi:hypothetical protein
MFLERKFNIFDVLKGIRCTLSEVVRFYLSIGHHTCAGIVFAVYSYGKDKQLSRILGSRIGGYEKFYLLKISSCSPLKTNKRFGGTSSLHFQP